MDLPSIQYIVTRFGYAEELDTATIVWSFEVEDFEWSDPTTALIGLVAFLKDYYLDDLGDRWRPCCEVNRVKTFKYCPDCGTLLKREFNPDDLVGYIQSLGKMHEVGFGSWNDDPWEISDTQNLLSVDKACILFVESRFERHIEMALLGDPEKLKVEKIDGLWVLE